MVTLSMVYHIRVEGDKFVPENYIENGFAFLSEWRNHKSADFPIVDRMIKELVTVLIPQWQDISLDHSVPDAGITPRLFVAALLSQYGTTISPNVDNTAEMLLDFDIELSSAVDTIHEGKSEEEISKAIKEKLPSANKTLVGMTQSLTGIKSTMHYLAESAQVLVKDITPFHEYIKARLDDWMVPKALHQKTAPSSQWVKNPNSGKLKRGLKQLDIAKEHLRDQDKLIMVRNNMFQYKQDIKSLLQHIDLNIGMVQYPRALYFVFSDSNHFRFATLSRKEIGPSSRIS
jgi:hypothetical protein